MKPSVFVERHAHSEPAAAWSDTVPACFRSEACAEGLQPPLANQGVARASSDGPPATSRQRWAAWGATLALLGRRPGAAP
jgi:hypothetical protein